MSNLQEIPSFFQSKRFPNNKVTQFSTISAVNCTPGQAKKITTDDFSLYFQTLGHAFLSRGDFNSKHLSWGFRLINTKDHSLYKSLLSNYLKHLSPSGPTYWPSHPNRAPDILDFFLHTPPNHTNLNIEN